MKANESKIAFIYFHKFFRIGTFQDVTPEENKKIQRRPTRLSGCTTEVSDGHRCDRPVSAIRAHLAARPSKGVLLPRHSNAPSATPWPKQEIFRTLSSSQERIALNSGISKTMSIFLQLPRSVRMLSRPHLRDASVAGRAVRPPRSHGTSWDRARASARILNDSKMIHLHSGALGAYSANIPASFLRYFFQLTPLRDR
jgi:hypothetical protein